MTGHDDYIDDPLLRETAARVHHVLHSDQMRPAFRDQLRAQLIAARAEAIHDAATGSVPPIQDATVTSPAPQIHDATTRPIPQRPPLTRPIPRRPKSPATHKLPRPAKRRRPLAVAGWLGAGVLAAAAAVALVVLGLPSLLTGTGPVTVAIRSDVAGTGSADPAAAVRLSFSQPLNHAATLSALRVQPYADMQKTWDGDTLVVKPPHGFAPNTGYLLTIDHAIARTTKGSALAADLHFVFGTAAVPGFGPPPATVLDLHRADVGGAADHSEAIVTRDGSLLLTEALPSAANGNRSGLLRVSGTTADQLSGNAAAICVSRSGDSIAYLADTGSATKVVFANSVGTPLGSQRVKDIDKDSPLGWIGDDLVTYVSRGQLTAIDRDGKTRSMGMPVSDPDSLVLAPGGGYAYAAREGLVPLIAGHAGKAHPLPGIVGGPAFSADGATVVWIDNSTGKARLSVAPSAGGPVFTAELPKVGAGDQISDMSVSPDGTHLVYTLTSGGHSELRLASLPDGDTLAISTDGGGASPNWSPSGRLFTILAGTGAGAHIETIAVPQALRDRGDMFEAVANAFANAQRSGDQGAQRVLSTEDASLPALAAAPSRADVMWLVEEADGTAQARIRLTVDPTIQHPAAVQAEETLTLGVPQGRTLPKVLKVNGGTPYTAAPAGPQLVNVDTDAVPGTVLLTFDSDLDKASALKAITVTAGGKQYPATGYDAAKRTVSVPVKSSEKMILRIDTDLRDASGHPLAAAVSVTY